MITLYIGFDSSNYGQELAYEVCKRSVLRFTKNVKIVKLDKKELQKKKKFTTDKVMMVVLNSLITDF